MKQKEKEALLSYAKELKELRNDMCLKGGIEGINFETEEAWKWSNRLQYIIDEIYEQAEQVYYNNVEFVQFNGYH